MILAQAIEQKKAEDALALQAFQAAEAWWDRVTISEKPELDLDLTRTTVRPKKNSRYSLRSHGNTDCFMFAVL